jgi:hypothetical protein
MPDQVRHAAPVTSQETTKRIKIGLSLELLPEAMGFLNVFILIAAGSRSNAIRFHCAWMATGDRKKRFTRSPEISIKASAPRDKSTS